MNEELLGAVIVISTDGFVLSWNSAAVALYGFTAVEAIGRTIFELTSPADNNGALGDLLGQPLNAAGTVRELMRRRKDGRVLPVETTVRLVEERGADPLVVLNERDITSVKYQREAHVLQTMFRGVLEAAPDAIVLVDATGRIAFLNSEVERLFCYDRTELLGQPAEILMPPRFRDIYPGHRTQYFNHPTKRGMGTELELFGLRKDQTEFPAEVSLSPLTVEGATLAMAAIRDATQRRKTEAKFRGLLEAAPDAMVIVNQAGVIMLVNSQAEKVFGYTRQEMLGQPVEMLVPMQAREAHVKHRTEYQVEPRRRPIESGLELLGRCKDGSEFRVEISLSPVETEDGTLVMAAVRDISDRVMVEDALKATARELETFTYSVSHDLRAPIRQIDGFSKILGEHLGTTADEKTAHYLQRIQEGTQHMGRLVDDLLQLAQLGRQSPRPRLTSLDEIVQDSIADLQPELLGRDVTWKIRPMPDTVCDPGLVKIAFANLLSNAVKYTRSKVNAVIEVGHLAGRGGSILFVRDNGVGFDMKYTDKLFGVFQRMHRAEDFEGTGVGLATVQRIVNKHGGEIWTEAEVDQGATFFITLGPGIRNGTRAPA